MAPVSSRWTTTLLVSISSFRQLGQTSAFTSSAIERKKMHYYLKPSCSLPLSENEHEYFNSQNHFADDAIDWEKYKLQQKYQKSGGILYKQSVLTPQEFQIITTELQGLLQTKLRLEKENSSSFATNRIGAQIGKETEIYRVLSDEEGSLCQLINCLVGGNDLEETGREGKMVLSQNIPVEVRIYEKPGAGMEWHIDDVLYDPEQIEVVFTVDNTSDCCTMWKPLDQLILDPHQNDESNQMETQQRYNIESAQTTPNSAIILKAGSVEHKVSSLKVGKRTILKMAFVNNGAVLDSSMERHVSHHSKSTSKKKPKKNNSANRKKR